MAWTLRFGAEDMYFKYFLMITWFQCRMKFLRYLSLSFWHRQVRSWEIQCLRETFYRWTCLEYLQSPRSEKKKRKIIPGVYVFPTETRGDCFWTFWWPAVGGDTFSPLAPILGPVHKKSGRVTLFYCSHAGECETKMFNIRIESMVLFMLAAFVRGRISVGSYQRRDRNTRHKTRRYCPSVSKDLQGKFGLNNCILVGSRYYNMLAHVIRLYKELLNGTDLHVRPKKATWK